MQITDMLNQYNRNIANGVEISGGTQGIKQIVSSLQEMAVGNVFEGSVNSLEDGVVTLGLSDGKTIQAKLDSGVSVRVGESMFFQVKSNNGAQIAIRPFSNGVATNPTLLNALDAANLQVNAKNLTMVNTMMEQSMSIDKQSLMNMAKLIMGNDGTDVASMVQMAKLGIPVNGEMAAQFENYKSDQYAILNQLESVMEMLPEQLANGKLSQNELLDLNQQMIKVFLGEGKPEIDGMSGSTVSQSVEGMPGSTVVQSMNELPGGTVAQSVDGLPIDTVQQSVDGLPGLSMEKSVEQSKFAMQNMTQMDGSVQILEQPGVTTQNPEQVAVSTQNIEVPENTLQNIELAAEQTETIQQNSEKSGSVTQNSMQPETVSQSAEQSGTISRNVEQSEMVFRNAEQPETISRNVEQSEMASRNAEQPETISRNTGGTETLSQSMEQAGTVPQNPEMSATSNTITAKLAAALGMEITEPQIQTLNQEIANGKLSRESMQFLEQVFSNKNPITRQALSELVTTKEYRTLVRNLMEQEWLLRPQELKTEHKVNELYNRLEQQLSQVEKVLKDFGQSTPQLADTAANVRNNIQFMTHLNQTYAYVQLPLKLAGQNAHSDLYVYTDKRKVQEKDGELTAFLHLDLDHLGSTDVSIKLHQKKVTTNFYLADDTSYQLILEHMDILEKRLEEKGYYAKIQVINQEEKVNFVEDLLRQGAPSAGGMVHRYSFDVRA